MDDQKTIIKNIKNKWYRENWRINAKLNEEQVSKIKKKYKWWINQYNSEIFNKIAEEYDVKPSTIKRIIVGKSWQWVK